MKALGFMGLPGREGFHELRVPILGRHTFRSMGLRGKWSVEKRDQARCNKNEPSFSGLILSYMQKKKREKSFFFNLLMYFICVIVLVHRR